MNAPAWDKERKRAFGDIESLRCAWPMVWYYQRVRSSIRHLAGDPKFKADHHLARMTFDQVREIRRYINTDLHNYSIEFYLQRKEWALGLECKPPREHIPRNHCQDPSTMRRGFRWIVDPGPRGYNYAQFLAETLPLFEAMHAHIVSINRALGDVHYYATELPFAEFTPVGKSEIRHLTAELDRVMTGLLVATHLQPREEWQVDIINYLVSCRTDCQRFLDTVPRYYHSHRVRLIVFPIDMPQENTEITGQPHSWPISCLPWASGVYMDFLRAYQTIVEHVMAVLHWAIRLYSLWWFVPRRVLRLISPVIRTA